MTSSHNSDFERVLENLEYKILSGIINPRERLIERELTEAYRISTGTVRKILKELAVKQLIKLIPNRGAVVTEPTFKESEDIYHTRILLENYALESVVKRITDERLEMIQAHEDAFENMLKSKDLRGILKYNRLFHQSIFEVSENGIVSDFIDQLRNRSRIWYHYVREDTAHQEKSIDDHRRMIACLRAGDAAGLVAVNTKHLSSGFERYQKRFLRRL